ncbi:hypothetical protein [Streptomyces sp. SAI-041]|jgi:hypothetical protein|uniref:hypothetical protein n=1 Tax=Streptomyces sp. SAI-041 TaxID=2940548 RepID=UPI0024763CF7|nr:hypothetical protein [Streptomyces sp. SAI-041]MDH6549005.1 hypothetical protein [Streptomyces sp. SAI-041]
MPTYEQLYHLNLSNLKAAADRWEATVGKFKGLHTRFGDAVAKPFQQAGWRQPVLTAAKAGNDVRAVHQEFADAQREAEGIAGVLTTLHVELQKAKDDLHHLADVEAKKHDLHVSATGVVTPRNDANQQTWAHHDPDGQALIRKQQQACDAFVRRIEAVLQRAAAADEIACWALRRDLGGYTDNFNSKVVTSLGAADAARAAELKRNAKTEADGWVAVGKTEVSGLGAGTSTSGPNTGDGSLGEAEAHADLGRASAEGNLTNGSFQLAGEAEAYAGAKASTGGSATNEGLQVQGSAFAGGEASAKGSAYLGPVGVYGRAEGLGGAEASSTATVGREGLALGSEAFAGAKGHISGGADVGGIGAGASAEGWAGIGAEGEATFGKAEDGKWRVTTHTGLAFGLGGAVGFEFTVDPGKVGDTVGDIADGLGSLI